MRFSKALVSVVALGLIVAWCSPTWAAADERPTRGTIQSVNADQHQLIVTDKNGKNWTYQVLDNAAIFIPNEANAKLSDLKSGEDVSLLWRERNGQYEASAILFHQGDYRNAGLSAATVKNVSSDNNQLTATDRNGKEWTYQMSTNAKFRQEGKNSRLSDFKTNEHVAIVWEKSGTEYRVLAMCNDPATSSR